MSRKCLIPVIFLVSYSCFAKSILEQATIEGESIHHDAKRDEKLTYEYTITPLDPYKTIVNINGVPLQIDTLMARTVEKLNNTLFENYYEEVLCCPLFSILSGCLFCPGFTKGNYYNLKNKRAISNFTSFITKAYKGKKSVGKTAIKEVKEIIERKKIFNEKIIPVDRKAVEEWVEIDDKNAIINIIRTNMINFQNNIITTQYHETMYGEKQTFANLIKKFAELILEGRTNEKINQLLENSLNEMKSKDFKKANKMRQAVLQLEYITIEEALRKDNQPFKDTCNF